MNDLGVSNSPRDKMGHLPDFASAMFEYVHFGKATTGFWPEVIADLNSLSETEIE